MQWLYDQTHPICSLVVSPFVYPQQSPTLLAISLVPQLRYPPADSHGQHVFQERSSRLGCTWPHSLGDIAGHLWLVDISEGNLEDRSATSELCFHILRFLSIGSTADLPYPWSCISFISLICFPFQLRSEKLQLHLERFVRILGRQVRADDCSKPPRWTH